MLNVNYVTVSEEISRKLICYDGFLANRTEGEVRQLGVSKILDVYEFAKLSNKSLNEKNIFKENDIASHVKDSYHAEIFTKYIYEILNENY